MDFREPRGGAEEGREPQAFLYQHNSRAASEPSATSWAQGLLILVSGGGPGACSGSCAALCAWPLGPGATGRRGRGHGLPGLLPKPRVAPTDRHSARGAGVYRQGKTCLSGSLPGGRGGAGAARMGLWGAGPSSPRQGPSDDAGLREPLLGAASLPNPMPRAHGQGRAGGLPGSWGSCSGMASLAVPAAATEAW